MAAAETDEPTVEPVAEFVNMVTCGHQADDGTVCDMQREHGGRMHSGGDPRVWWDHQGARVSFITAGSDLIATERRRQIEREGVSPEHDDKHDRNELVAAAACYLQAASFTVGPPSALPVQEQWPWAPEDWKPSDDPVRNLVKAGALIAAEIDRLLR